MRNLKIYSLLVLLVALSSCSDFLRTEDPNEITDDTYWQSENDVLYAIYGCYDVLQRGSLYGGGPYAPTFRDHDTMGDDSFNAWGWNGMEFIADGTITADHDFMQTYWADNYAAIARANRVIENAPSVEELTEDKLNAYLAEARFIRALGHFNLVNGFGDVPLILEVQSIEEVHIAKSPKEEVMLQVIEDLEFAAQYAVDGDFGRVNPGAAYGLLTRVYLYDEQYDKVLECSEKVMGMGYELFKDYNSLFSESNEQCKEIVFSVLFESLREGEGESFSGTWAKSPQTHHQPMANFVNDFYCTDGLPIGSSPLFDPENERANRDERLDACVLFPNEIWVLGGAPFDAARSNTGYCIQKYVRNTVLYITDGPQDFYLIRYADILLMRAEALIELNRLDQEAYDLINAVRTRANMPIIEDVEGSGLSQDALRKILQHERRVELAQEGFRFYDLKRWGLLQEARERAAQDPINGNYNPNYQGEKSLYWPLPQKEVDTNRLLEQNPLWN